VSVPLQNAPSLQPVPFGSAPLQASAASLHDAAQFPSDVLSGRHGSPAWPAHVPPVQVSLPLQKAPSLQPVPLGSAELQASPASLHEVAQLLSVVLTGQGSPAWLEHVPPLHVSAPLQKVPSLQPVPLASAALQASPASLHEVAQLLSVVLAGQGSPAWLEHDPPLQVSAPLQKAPSLQPVPLGSAALQASPASLHDVEQLLSVVLTGQGSPV